MARRPSYLLGAPEPANETEMWDRIAGGVAAENAAQSIHGATYIDPARAAQANELSRRLGIPAALVEADVPGYDDQARRQAASAAARDNPTYARMMSNPRFAAAAVGDHAVPEVARWVGNATVGMQAGAAISPFGVQQRMTQRVVDSFNHNALTDIIATSGNMAGEGLAGLGEAAYDLLTLRTFGARSWQDDVADELKARGRLPQDYEPDPVRRGLEGIRSYYQQTRPQYQVRTGNEYIDAAISGFESVPLQVTALGLAASGNPGAGLAMMASVTGGQAYGEARDAGLSPARSLIYAGIQGGLEAAGEMLPLGQFAHDATRGSGFLRTLMGQFLTEVPGEQFTQHLQDFNTWAAIEANQGKTFGDFMAERPRVFRDTLIATIAAVGLQTAAGHAVASAARRTTRAQAALDAGRSIDQLMAHATDSPTRRNNPSDFEAVLSSALQDSANENLYIPAAQVRALFQSPEDMSGDSFWGDYREQITEAEALGGDVVIPLASAVTHLAGSPQWEALKDHVRTSGGGMSRAEATEAGPEMLRTLTEQAPALIAEMDAQDAAHEPRQRVFDQMREKLEGAGFTPGVASQYAELFASRAATRAQRLGRELAGNEADNLTLTSDVAPQAGRTFTQSQRDEGGRSVPVQRNGDVPLATLELSGLPARSHKEALADLKASTGEYQMASGETVGISRKVTDKALSGYSNDIKRSLVGSFPRIVESAATYADAGEHTYAAARLRLDGKDYAVRLVLRTVADGGKRLYQLEGFDFAPVEGRQTISASPEAQVQPGARPASAADANVAELVSTFNSIPPGDFARFQDAAGGARGMIGFDADGKAVISLFANRNLSTFIHESGHLFLEELKLDAEVATHFDTPEGRQLFADFETLKAWFKREGHEVTDGQPIPTGAHELFARGFERYVMEGKAPSSGLRRAFDSFRRWLVNIYKTARGLKAPITPEVRDVMSRLLATDEEISAAAHEQGIRLGFESADLAKMTGAEFGAYRRLAEEAKGEAHDALLKKVMTTVRAARTKEYRANEASARADVTEAVDAQPLFTALARLRDKANPAKLDRQFLLDTYGEDALDKVPQSVPPIYSDTNTIHPDILAEEVGFKSGDEMIRALMEHEATRKEMRTAGDTRTPRRAAIDEATSRIMAQEYGDPLEDGTIEEEARAIIHNDKQGEVFATELRALARTSGKKPTPYRIAKQWAAEKIAAGQVASVASGSAIQRYARAAAKAGREFEQALAKGDRNEAFKQKQAQMLNNALVSAAREAKDRIDIAVRRLGKLAKAKTRASMDQDYLDRIHGLLEQVEFRPRSQASLDEQQGYEAWAMEQQKSGVDLVKSPAFAASLGTTHWSRLSVEQLIGLDDTVQQIAHLGRLKQTLLDGDKRRKYEEGRDELIGSADGSGKGRKISALNDPRRSLPQRAKSWIRMADAAMLKVEQIVDWLDGGKSNGPWNRLLFKPLADAQGAEGDLMRSYVEQVNALIKEMPPKQARDWDRRVDTPELVDRVSSDPMLHGRPMEFGKDQIVMMALNWGNEGNRQRLLDGYGWKASDAEAVFDRLMTSEDWSFVQSIWDTLETLKAPLFEMERRVNGVEPDAVQALPFDTAHGPMKGGYFPAVYDPTYQTQKQMSDAEQMIGGGGFFRASTRSSATKERAAQVRKPLLLNMSVITNHMRSVIHDITHREAVQQTAKILADNKIRNAIDRRLGPEYVKSMDAWLTDVARPGSAEGAPGPFATWIGRHLHKGTTVAGLGFRMSTILMQPLGLANIVGITGKRAAAEGMGAFLKNPRKVYQEVIERSAEMRDRFSTLDASIADAYRDQAKPGLRKLGPSRIMKAAFWGIGFTDMLITTGGWIGSFNKGLREGMTEEEATFYADKVIRTSQGAAGAKDRSGALRAPQLVRSFYPFFSYLNALYNQQRDIGRSARNASSASDVAKIVGKTWWIAIVPVLAQAALFGQGPDEDDEESWAAYLTRNAVFGNFASIPGIGSIANSVGNGWTYRSSSVQGLGEQIVNTVHNVKVLADGDADTNPRSDWIKSMFTVIGTLTHQPLGAPGAAAQFLASDDQPEDVADWYTGLTTGRVPAH